MFPTPASTAAAAEAAIAANTSQGAEEAGQQAKKLLHEVARHATEGFKHATDASGSGGLLELKYTQELAPQVNPQGSAVGPAPNHVHSPAAAEEAAEQEETPSPPAETTGNGAADPETSTTEAAPAAAAAGPGAAARLGEPEVFRVHSVSKHYGQEYTGIAPMIGDQEVLLQLYESPRESIKISLDGIIYSVADHHPFTRTKRQGLTPEQKKAYGAASAAVFPDEDKCVLPKLQSKNFKEHFDSVKAELDQLAQQTTSTEETAKTALTPAQTVSYQTTLEGLRNKTAEMRRQALDINANEMKVKKGNATCFLSALSTEASSVLGVKDNTTVVEQGEKGKEMCSEAWNATVPDCCKEGCGNQQMENLVNDLEIAIGFLEHKQTAYKNAQDAATDDAAKAANKQMLEKTTSEIAESNVKRRLVMAAEREAKSSERLSVEEVQAQLLEIR